MGKPGFFSTAEKKAQEVTGLSNKDETISAGGLDELLNRSDRAQQYFSSLPKYAQDMIMQRRQNIQTEDALRSYGDNITQGDK